MSSREKTRFWACPLEMECFVCWILHDDQEAFWIQNGLKNDQIIEVAVSLALQCNEYWVIEKFNNK